MTFILRSSRRLASTAFMALPSFVAALFPVATMVLANLSVLQLTEWVTWRPLVLVSAGVTITLLASRLITADLAFRAATVAVWCVLVELHSTVSSMLPASWAISRHPFGVVVYLAIASGAAVVLGRRVARPENRPLLIGVSVALLLVMSSLFLPGVRSRVAARWSDARDRIASTASQAPVVATGGQMRDVYYFVLDGLVRADVAEELYGVNLTPFQDGLRRRGFAVPAHSRSNYGQTHLSLASSLNMSYLDALAPAMGDGNDRTPLHELVAWSGVIRRFHELGYEFVMIGSDYTMTVRHRLADRCYCHLDWGATELESALLENSIVSAMVKDAIYDMHRRKVLGAFAAAESLGTPRRPLFVFAHIVAPHPPFVFEPDGRPRPQREFFSFRDGTQFPGTPNEYRRGYAAQVRFVLARLLALIDRIDADGRTPAIIVQGDHGSGLGLDQANPERSDARERLSIMMAVRAPGGPVPDDLTPVNVFRVVFNRLFRSAYAVLPNRSYMSSWQQPYRFHAVDLTD